MADNWMADVCGNCRFALHRQPPAGERPVVPPLHVFGEESPQTFWGRTFSRPAELWMEPAYIEWKAKCRAQRLWDEQKFDADNKVSCRARPEVIEKYKGEWCGLYEPAQAMEARQGGDAKQAPSQDDSAVAKPCAQGPAGSNRHG